MENKVLCVIYLFYISLGTSSVFQSRSVLAIGNVLRYAPRDKHNAGSSACRWLRVASAKRGAAVSRLPPVDQYTCHSPFANVDPHCVHD